MCSPCAIGCESCLSANETECLTCSTGYREGTASEQTEAVEGEEEKKQTVTCVDINECVEQSDLCPVGEYCANTEGSYTCELKKEEASTETEAKTDEKSEEKKEEASNDEETKQE